MLVQISDKNSGSNYQCILFFSIPAEHLLI